MGFIQDLLEEGEKWAWASRGKHHIFWLGTSADRIVEVNLACSIAKVVPFKIDEIDQEARKEHIKLLDFGYIPFLRIGRKHSEHGCFYSRGYKCIYNSESQVVSVGLGFRVFSLTLF